MPGIIWQVKDQVFPRYWVLGTDIIWNRDNLRQKYHFGKVIIDNHAIIYISKLKIFIAPLAQSAEHSHGKAGVVGSIPTGGSVSNGGVAQLVRAHGS